MLRNAEVPHDKCTAARGTARRLLPAVLLACVLAVAGGCVSGKWGGSADGQITELHLLGTPVAIDLDGKKGPDGVGVRVYASQAGGNTAVRIPRGNLKLLLFDGAVSSTAISETEPMLSFAYTAGELRKMEHKTAVGVSYNFVPAWRERAPTKGRITIVGVYETGSTTPVWSQPITVPLGR